MEKLLSFVENVSKVAGALSIAGYLSLRAHFNFLGVSSLTPLTIERYLMETYIFVILSLQSVLTISPVIFAVAGIGWGLWYLITRQRPNSISAIFWQLLLFGLLLIAVALTFFLPPAADVVVGNLKSKAFGSTTWVFKLLMVTAMVGVITLTWRNGPLEQAKGGPVFQLWIARLNWFLLFAVAILLPVRFGAEIHPRHYPIASLKLKANENLKCGLLLYQNGESLVLWEAAKGFGRIRKFETKSVDELIVGEVMDIVHTAGVAAKNEANVPDCRVLGI